MNILFAAVHQGPYLSLRSLEEASSEDQVSFMVQGAALESRRRDGLPRFETGSNNPSQHEVVSFIERHGINAVVRGTSEDIKFPNVEALAAAAAVQAGIPLFVVEDFPGNYQAFDGSPIDGLFVEDQWAQELHCSSGLDREKIFAYGNPRYDKLRDIDRDRSRQATRAKLGLSDEKVVLWLGQPAVAMSFEALTRLLGLWGRDDVVFLFRAHPRDTTQQQGRYGPLLEKSSLRVLDVSYHTDSLALYCGADLVATQFSSAAVEASHMGIPALFVLFDDLGKEYLRKNKGYEELPWTQQGCSFLIEDEDQVANVMDRALFDQAARDEVLANFQNRYRHVAASAPAIMNRIRTITGRIIQTGDSQRLPTQRQF